MAGLTRREMIAGGAALAGLGLCPDLEALVRSRAKYRRISACDWSVNSKGKIEAFQVGKEIGLQGIEVSFGKPGEGLDLRKDEVRKEYVAAARKHGMTFSSTAMGVLNREPFATLDVTEKWVADCIEATGWLRNEMYTEGAEKDRSMSILLAFFGKGNIRGKKDLQDRVIERLKRLAPAAEKAKVILGVESQMNAEEHQYVVDAVASPAVQVYYDVANMTQLGYDVPKEIRQLGRKRICQIHMKERNALLGKGKIDFAKIKEAVDEIGYEGWFVIEGATTKGKSLVECYQENRKFLQELFPESKK